MRFRLCFLLTCFSCFAQTNAPTVSETALSSFEEKTFSFDGVSYGFRVLSPPKLEPGRRYPLLYFMHGAGERGSDNQISLRFLPDQMARAPYRNQFPAFVVVPQCRLGHRWVEADWGAVVSSRMRPEPSPMMAMAMALLDQVLREYPVDSDRVYLAGVSMGGYGAWELAARRPGTFAALAPICGGGDEATARLLATLPIWTWHSALDAVVPSIRSRRMVEAIRAADGSPRYTELPGAAHTSFLQAFAPESGVMAWMFAQHRGPARSDSANNTSPRLRVLCAGDSNTEAREFPGYRAYLKQELDRRGIAIDFVGSKRGGEPWSDPEHEGYSGEGIARIRQRVREGMIEQYSPDVILLLVGSNDLWKDVRSDRSPADDAQAQELAAEAVDLIRDMARRSSHVRILVGLPATPTNTAEALRIYRSDLEAGVKKLAATGAHVAAVDMAGLQNDGVHYSNEGFRQMAARWADNLSSVRRSAVPIGSALPPQAIYINGPTDSVPVFDYAEIRVDVKNPTALNPFTDVVVNGEFRDPDGHEHKMEGFSDSAEGTRFLVRIMPQRVGSYHWRVSFRQSQFERTVEGSFETVAGKLRGPVRVDAAHPAHFLYEGGSEHFFWVGTTAYALAGWRDESIIRESLERLAGSHINRARVAIMAPRVQSGAQWKEPAIANNGWFSFCVNPWPAERPDDVDNPGFNPHRFNVEYWQKYERLLRYARELGIQVSVIFYVDGRLPGVDPFREPAMGGDLEQLYYRYAVARLAAFSNVMWDITNEYRLFRNDQWAAKMGTLIRAYDPYAHLMSIHGHGDFRFRSAPWVDFAMYQSWDEHGGYEFMLRNREQQAATGRVMPQINEEYGYEDHYPFPWGEARLWPARTADNRRRLAWLMTMAGGYQTTGERANVPDYGGWINGRGSAQMEMLPLYGLLYKFWTAREWWRMEPLQHIGPDAIPCLGIADSEYVFYLPHGEAIPVHLPGSGYRAMWFNPRSGEYSDAGVTRSAEWNSPSAPDAEDWLLIMKRPSGEVVQKQQSPSRKTTEFLQRMAQE